MIISSCRDTYICSHTTACVHTEVCVDRCTHTRLSQIIFLLPLWQLYKNVRYSIVKDYSSKGWQKPTSRLCDIDTSPIGILSMDKQSVSIWLFTWNSIQVADDGKTVQWCQGTNWSIILVERQTVCCWWIKWLAQRCPFYPLIFAPYAALETRECILIRAVGRWMNTLLHWSWARAYALDMIVIFPARGNTLVGMTHSWKTK